MTLVEVYRNIRARNWSVRDARTKLVLHHAQQAGLRNVTFRVSQAGRARVLRERRKNVHAWARGELIEVVEVGEEIDGNAPLRPRPSDVQVYYDPYKVSQFTVKETGEPIESARLALFTTKGVYVIP